LGHIIQETYRGGGSVPLAGSEHIWTCPLSGLSVPQIAEYIGQAELKMGAKPAVVCVDYIGLVRGIGKRYERVSDIAQDLKVLAKTSRTVMVEVSQIHRKPGQAGMPIGLHDAKDSGEVENSAGLVLGCWRDREDKNVGYVKVLKCTKGIAGRTVKVKIDFPRISQLEADYKIES
jgi:replicative DNA helicase